MRHCHAGVLPGARVMLVGSLASELAAVEAAQAAQAALRLPSFEHEAARAAARRRGGASSSTGAHTGRRGFSSWHANTCMHADTPAMLRRPPLFRRLPRAAAAAWWPASRRARRCRGTGAAASAGGRPWHCCRHGRALVARRPAERDATRGQGRRQRHVHPGLQREQVRCMHQWARGRQQRCVHTVSLLLLWPPCLHCVHSVAAHVVAALPALPAGARRSACGCARTTWLASASTAASVRRSCTSWHTWCARQQAQRACSTCRSI